MERTALLKKALGHKGIMFLLYLAFFALHAVISAAAYLPSIDPNEFSTAALANMFIGGDWTAAMSRSDYFYGFLQSFLYVPIMLVTKDPFIQYRLMVLANGAVMSFIPVIVYSCSLMLGVSKRWQAVFSAVCCGGWMTYAVHSKFIWNETAAMFLPWLLLYVLLRTDKAEHKSSKAVLSVVLAFIAAACYCAHQRLIAAILALSVTVILARVLLKRKSVNLPAYFISLAVFGFLAVIGNYAVQNALWGAADPALLQNTAESFFAELPAMLADGGGFRFLTALCSQLYYYVCSSWGLGALGISMLAAVLWRYFSCRRLKKEKKAAKTESDAKPSSSNGLIRKAKAVLMTSSSRRSEGSRKHSASVSADTDIIPIHRDDRRLLFVFFAVLLTVFMLFVGACYRFGAESFEASQSAILFGRYIDGVIPFTVLFVLTFMHTEGLSLTEILGGFIAASASYLCFFFTGRQAVISAVSATISPMLGLYPVMFGESTGTLVTSTGLIAAISCAMCLLAVMVVIESCAGKLKKVIMSAAVTALTVYSLFFGVFFYLPLSNSESIANNAEYTELSSYLYNSSDAPDITVYQCSRSCVMMMQYLNQNLTVRIANQPEEIEEDTYLIVPVDSPLRFDPQQLYTKLITQTENYILYACGDRAIAYAQLTAIDN